MRIFQLLPTITYGDAVGNDTLAIDAVLRKHGYETMIYAENIGRRVPSDRVRRVHDLPELSGEDVVIYHLSTGTALTEQVGALPCRKIIIYHNITPGDFFLPYSGTAWRQSREGRSQMRALAEHADYCLADSGHNAEELREAGYRCPIDILPILIPFEDYDQPADRAILKKYRGDGITNLLFTGRIAPNKKQEDIIRAFAAYKKYYNPDSRLFLVGSYENMESYYARLKEYAERLGLGDSVIFTGHIPFSEILAYYRLADAFVCMSEHEGFCVPLAEAMHFGVPVVAYDSTAVGETLGGSGFLLKDKDPVEAAGAINYILTHSEVRNAVVEAEKERLKDFRHDTVEAQLLEYLEKFLGDTAHARAVQRKRVLQVLPAMTYGDAVGNDALALQDTLRRNGYDSMIYSPVIGPRIPEDCAKPIGELPQLRKEDTVIYHFAIGTDLNLQIAALPCRKILVYHNITPSRFFAKYDRNSWKLCRMGREQLKRIATRFDYCLAVSDYNAGDLRKAGFRCPINVLPILIPFEDYEKPADPAVMNRYSGDGCTNILFTGRIVPNKKQEDVIRAFGVYKNTYNPHARLFLVGSYDGMERYYNQLKNYTAQLGLTDSVIFTGHIPFSEILAYYRLADLFLCMSEHEGFCVPLAEAMYFGIPIAACDTSAISSTLGGSGILLKDNDPQAAAEAMNRVLTDSSYREELIRGEKERLKEFDHDVIEKRFLGYLSAFLEEKNE